MRPTTSCAIIIKNILYPTTVDTSDMKYGYDREVARKELSAKLNKDKKFYGLFIDMKIHICFSWWIH